ncbi:nitroreductase family protein [Acinetobacter sp. ANC 4558]|uniref:nitroreductase family protein n=1 Tax=Acinetobacter sp. ANC 4558 TaxID=1977876 RepID=UPI000A35AB0F|nr:nitroreductase family protein [Acinetobacter sp. ANC 4558]OTG86754.1 nitroreductase family protein [Acinetobacter sp. ANC 4558]
MNILEAIQSRRATKRFDENFVLSFEEKKALLSLCLENAPSAFNLQHWRLVLVESKEQRKKIHEIAWNQPQVLESSMLVVICAQKESWQYNARRVWDGAASEVQDYMSGAIDQYYRGHLAVQRDEVMRSAGIFAQTLMLAAQGKDLDSCPMDGFDFSAMANIIDLPNDHAVCMMVAIGKSTAKAYPKVGKLPFDELVKIDHFNSNE